MESSQPVCRQCNMTTNLLSQAIVFVPWGLSHLKRWLLFSHQCRRPSAWIQCALHWSRSASCPTNSKALGWINFCTYMYIHTRYPEFDLGFGEPCFLLPDPKCILSVLSQEFLKTFCEDEHFLSKRRKALRVRAGIREEDTKLALSPESYIILLYKLQQIWSWSYLFHISNGYQYCDWHTSDVYSSCGVIFKIQSSAVLCKHVRSRSFGLWSWRANVLQFQKGRPDNIQNSNEQMLLGCMANSIEMIATFIN